MNQKILEAVNRFKEHLEKQTKEECDAFNQANKENTDLEHSIFLEAYQRNECYLCSKPFKTISKEKPCLHWLLRMCKFKKKDFPNLFSDFSYHQISSFLRWVSHAETGVKNINDLEEEKSDRKIFETTIKWKNIDWTLDCSHNDYAGHEKTKTDFPHWHFQMRIDGRQFINFNDYHIPFSDDDLFKLALLVNDPESKVLHSYGSGGTGMQEVMDAMTHNFDAVMESSVSAENEEDGAFHMSTAITGKNGGISGEKFNEAFEMYRKTGQPLAHCFNQVLKDDENVNIRTMVSASDSVPEIARRTERKRR